MDFHRPKSPLAPAPPPVAPVGEPRGAAVLLAAAATLLVLVSPLWTRRLDPNTYLGGRSQRQSDIVQRNTSAVGVLLGELRSSMSDLMYIKTERYLDQGIAYYPHLDMKAMESEGTIQTKGRDDSAPDTAAQSTAGPPAPGDETPPPPGHEHETPEEHAAHAVAHPDHEEPDTVGVADIELLKGREHAHEEEGEHADEGEHEHEGEAEEYAKTVVREAADDFRGFIGYLERNIKPWRDPRLPHNHGGGTELLPWFRLQTLSDPQNVRSYLIGAWWLKRAGKVQTQEALTFIEEGIRNNPDAFQLYLMKGSILQALGRGADALPTFRQSAELAFRIRPLQGDDNPNAEKFGWDHYKEQDVRTATRMAVLLEKVHGTREEALRLSREYLARLEKDGILEHQIRILTGLEPDPMDQPGNR